jgi:hypothetical protein
MKKVTSKPINFEDTLYLLHTRIQAVYDILILDTSPDLFLEKTMDDVDFINKTLDSLMKIITEDTSLVERDEQLDNMSEMEWHFSQALTKFLSASGDISATRFPAHRDKILALRSQSTARRKIADDSRSKTNRDALDPLVSQDEMNELLKSF